MLLYREWESSPNPSGRRNSWRGEETLDLRDTVGLDNSGGKRLDDDEPQVKAGNRLHFWGSVLNLIEN